MFRCLLESGRLNNITVAPLFTSSAVGHYAKAFGAKIKVLRDFAAGLPASDIVLHLDGYDVHISGSRDRLLAAYWRMRRLHGDVVFFGAQTNCFRE